MSIGDRLLAAWVQKEKLPFPPAANGSYFMAELERICAEGDHPVCRALWLIQENYNTYDKAGDVELRAYLSHLNLADVPLIELFFLYFLWFRYDLRFNRRDEAMSVFNKLENLMCLDVPRALRSEYYYSQGSLLPQDEAVDFYKKSIALADMGSHQYKRHSVCLPILYAMRGELQDFGTLELGENVAHLKDYNAIINSFVLGQMEEVEQYDTVNFKEGDRLEGMLKHALDVLWPIKDLYKGTGDFDEKNYGARAVKALMGHQLDDARKLARLYFTHAGMLDRPEFYNHSMVRVELCAKNVNAASLIISQWDSRGDQGSLFIADFFRARLELLKGNLDQAILYFSQVFKFAEKYGGKGRLNFEMDISHELKPSQIRLLVEGAMKLSKTDKVLISSDTAVISGIDLLKGQCDAIEQIKNDVVRFANLDVPVLILGETGVGKDVVANALHLESNRKEHPFLAINCSAIVENLLQSELFGYQAGAYTGASKAHKGIFEEAGQGTVFLDEIGDISVGVQSALLRVLESGDYRPVGSSKPRKIQCQIIAATNVALELAVEKGTFRKDLFYRLKRLVISVPPLRERGGDILLLSDYFLNTNKVFPENVAFSDALKHAFNKYEWPGNVRELKNAIETMRLLNSDKLFYDMEDAGFLKDTLATEPDTVQIEPERASGVIAKAPEYFLQKNKAIFRRMDTIKKLFLEHKELTRKEVAQMMECRDRTIGRDIKKLVEEGFLEKVEPTKSPRTHYFILKE